MVITLVGANGFGLDIELHKLVQAFVVQYGELSLERIDCQEAEIEQIREALTGLPFLSAKKMVVLRSPTTNKQFVEQAETLLEGLPDTTDLIIVEAKLDKRLALYKYLKKSTDYREFAELDNYKLASWLADEAKAGKGSISTNDARYLIERVGTNQLLLASELQKLLIYEPKITRGTIELLTEATPQSTIFDLLEAAFNGRTERAIGIYEEQRAQKVEPVQIIAMLSWQLHILAVIKTAGDRSSDQIAKEARINPYVIGKSQAIARTLSYQKLKTLIAELLDIDVKSKSQAIDIDAALKLYLIKLAD